VIEFAGSSYEPAHSLNYQTPAEFAAGWRNGKYEEKRTDITN
jgi:putative transposase